MNAAGTFPMRRVIVLGSTGSIGVNTLEVIAHLNRHAAQFEIVGLAAGSNIELLGEQAAQFGVQHAALASGDRARGVSQIKHVYRGGDSARQLIQSVARPGDLVVGAIVGAAGISATLEAIERGCDIALANKETLVAAGALVMPRVRARGVNLLPVDSEHSAIFQCLQAARQGAAERQGIKASWPGDLDDSMPRCRDASIRRIVITASGGPFRMWSRERMDRASVDEALNHPTWNMGPKVTIDSASLMNKALEIVEAHWLFDLAAEKIEVIIHPQSIVHGLVEFVDGSVISQLGPPDMRTPIQHALTWPNRAEGISRQLDWANLKRMDFEQVDREKFPALDLGYEAIRRGGSAGAILNAANEAAVCAFLERRISFGQIVPLVQEAMEAIPATPLHSIADVFEADARARQFVNRRVAAGSKAELLSRADG